MYAISTTTAIVTTFSGLQNVTANIKGQTFESYTEAVEAAEAYAIERGAFYVKPAAQAPNLKEGQTYVEVVAA